MFDALFFDLDGTLLDTETLALRSGHAAFAAQGHAVDDGFMHRLVGVDLPSSAAIIRGAFPELDLDALHTHWRAGFQEEMSQGVPLKSGVEALLSARLRPMALVTSSGREEALHKLAITGLGRYFDTVVTLHDVTRAKPHPEPYLLAAELLAVDPARCLVFEDSETGAEAAHRAGCVVVQVPDVVPSRGKWAHHLAPSLLDGARMAGLLP